MNRRTRSKGNEEGSSLLEFSLMLPILVFIVLGIVDLSQAITQSIVVTQAAEAGAAYGTLAGNQSNYSGMQTAAVNAANGLSGFNPPVATNWCSCAAGGTAVSCSSSCSGSASPIMYVQVQTSATEQVLPSYPGLPASFSLNGISILRVQ
jgi:Flp pilus assembly protein TadG